VLAGIVAAGLDGLRNQILPDDDAYCAGDGYANPSKVKVPSSLPMALDAFEADDVLKDALGVQFSSWFLKLKRDECAEFPDSAVPLSGDDEDAKALHAAEVAKQCKALYQPLI
jgi:glutamine synthetase